MIKAPLYNLKAEKIGDVVLPAKVFENKPNHPTVSIAIKSYLGNIRRAGAKTKHRGEVAGTTKKMWAQKGTGRARHGSAKAPIFVGGGSAHGPRGDRNFTTKLSQSQRQLALSSVLSSFALNKSIIVIDKVSSLGPKTKSVWDFIDKLEVEHKTLANSRRIGVVLRHLSPNLKRAFRNIPGITLISLESLHPYHLSSQNFLIFSKLSIKSL